MKQADGTIYHDSQTAVGDETRPHPSFCRPSTASDEFVVPASDQRPMAHQIRQKNDAPHESAFQRFTRHSLPSRRRCATLRDKFLFARDPRRSVSPVRPSDCAEFPPRDKSNFVGAAFPEPGPPQHFASISCTISPGTTRPPIRRWQKQDFPYSIRRAPQLRVHGNLLYPYVRPRTVVIYMLGLMSSTVKREKIIIRKSFVPPRAPSLAGKIKESQSDR